MPGTRAPGAARTGYLLAGLLLSMWTQPLMGQSPAEVPAEVPAEAPADGQQAPEKPAAEADAEQTPDTEETPQTPAAPPDTPNPAPVEAVEAPPAAPGPDAAPSPTPPAPQPAPTTPPANPTANPTAAPAQPATPTDAVSGGEADTPPLAPAAPAAPAESVSAESADGGTATQSAPANRAQSEQQAAAGAPPGANADADRPGITGSLLYWGQAISVGALDRAQQLSYDPQYTWQFDALLRWNFNHDDNVRVLQSAAVELTDSNVDVRGQRLLLSDTRVRFTHELPATDLGDGHRLRYFTAGELIAPSSKASQAATLILGGAARASMAWMSRGPLSGMQHWLLLALRGNAYRSEVGEVADPYPCRLAGAPASQNCRQGTTSNAAWSLALSTMHSLNIRDDLWASLTLSYGWSRAFGFDSYVVDTATGPFTVEDSSRTHMRNLGFVGFTLNYMATPYLIVAAEMNNTFAERGPNGGLRGPLDPQDVFLGVSLMVLIEPLLPRSLTQPDA